jgi:hypothetical protein
MNFEKKRGFDKNSIFTITFIITTAICLSDIHAQNYGFEVPKETVDVYIEPDASMNIKYEIIIKTLDGYDPIDVVDIGFPTNDYNISTVKAKIDEKSLNDIRVSSYIPIGVEVHLNGDDAIYPGETSTLEVEGTNYKMVWEDRENSDYAGVEFTPTWFDSSVAHGTTDLTVRIYLPPEIEKAEPKWHEKEPTEMGMKDMRIVYVWHIPDAYQYSEYKFGVSFPKRVITGEIRPSSSEPITENLQTYKSKVEEVKTSGYSAELVIFYIGIGIIFLLLVVITIVSLLKSRSQKMSYFPASASMEGVDIKRGLTAPEASIILELPVEKTIALILYGLIIKSAITVLSIKPIKLKKNKISKEIKLRAYEIDFIQAIDKNGGLDKNWLKEMLIIFIKSVQRKMKGFSLINTKIYYRDIVSKAWKMLKEAKAPQDINSILNEKPDWLMMDDDFEKNIENSLAEREVMIPSWFFFIKPSLEMLKKGIVSETEKKAITIPIDRIPIVSETITKLQSMGKEVQVSELKLPSLPGSSIAYSITSGLGSISESIAGEISHIISSVISSVIPPSISTVLKTSESSGGSRIWERLGSSSSSSSSSSCVSCACACACVCVSCACACAGGGR